MKKSDQLRYNALKRVQDFNVLFALILAPIVEFLAEKLKLDTLVTKIEDAMAIQNKDIKAVAVNKEVLENIMAETIFKFQLRAAVRANQLALVELELSLDKPISYITRNEDDVVILRANEIKNIMKTNLGVLDNLTPADIVDMEAAIAAYVDKKDEPDEAIDDRKSLGTDPIPELLNQADVPKNNIGKLVLSYLPDKAHQWDTLARVGKPTSVRHTSIALRYTDFVTGAPLKDVKAFASNGLETIEKLSTRKGWVRFISLDTGNWSVTSEHPVYRTDSKTDIDVFEDKMVRFDVQLQKQGPPEPETTTGILDMFALDMDTGLPIFDAQYTLQPANRVGATDEDGEGYEDLIPPGEYTGQLIKDGYNHLDFDFTIIAGETATLQLFMEKAVI